ncbi:maleylpyruvate isomerase N-terminal domain-containing protein [Tomitella fengzijianii]|uniref:Maleylpyruvate isomerase family mycothiol-dependent enzyme n=1 Tax=Tomitella fengzijianii TaxID=2597660 RepID=A0A516X775_9ACTN|nr:maleylpyruvate isomerase N-terminal domain-containing protein [Tomitella fengzijianii]QDQ98521.1 maleylpyruvate isomerase family mycothiol-dependent enzyme [Tomitella fengzijianii]
MGDDYGVLVDEVHASGERLQTTLAGMAEKQAREASLLPGWTRGHVVTHLARNADAMWRFARGVLDGRPAPEMYPGGADARSSAIEEGADRPVELLRADAAFAGARATRAMGSIDAGLRDAEINWKHTVPARMIPVLRWRELEIHHVDLGLGYVPADWPATFVSRTLDTELPALQATGWDGETPDLPEAELLAWLIGRPTREGLPAVPSWPY